MHGANMKFIFKIKSFIRLYTSLHKLWPQVTLESYTNRVQRPVRRVQEF